MEIIMGKQLVKIVKEICKEEKINFKSYSDDYILQLEANKELMYIFGNKFPNNNAAVEQICNDKAALSSILDFYGIPHVPHFYFNSPTATYNISPNGNWGKMKSLLKKYGVLVCKPNKGTGGNNIYKINNQHDLESAVQKIFSISNSMCISPYYDIKKEYRIVAVRDEIQYVFEKIRCYVIGNGVDSIYQLCSEYSNNENIFNNNFIDWNVIPNKGERVELTWKHNLGQGAIPLLVTDEKIKRQLTDLARKCVSALNTGFVSIDIIETDNALKVLEINSGVMIEKFSEHSKKIIILLKML